VTFDSDLIDAVKADYQYVDGVVTVSYKVRATSATTATVKGVPAAPAMKEEEAGATSKVTRQAWLLWVDTMGAITPAAGDTITDSAGIAWTVNEYAGPALGVSQVYFRCECVKQR
jgi:hypothetical protein